MFIKIKFRNIYQNNIVTFTMRDNYKNNNIATKNINYLFSNLNTIIDSSRVVRKKERIKRCTKKKRML